ncbi:flagellar motor switch protein FliN [Pacificimonas flava]|uniref:Flagellar motor switch protein FliN n=1 Tax=Pacificimonas flava TaxID=1234595 RepID=M2SFN8_9SPHN|nr:flagellar motor switch protein FliN [Pacificimonas flava]EMD84185.1 Flagellar motor switch FliN [Pacificimonas flava]MBB5279937.1 flagellar motor switch protein FliN/FliY [Pacificimonas flava]
MTDQPGKTESVLAAEAGATNISTKLLERISVRVSVELGSTTMRLRDLLALEEGGVVELASNFDEPLSIYANGALLGRGEVVKSGDRFGIRFTEISDAEERLRSSEGA